MAANTISPNAVIKIEDEVIEVEHSDIPPTPGDSPGSSGNDFQLQFEDKLNEASEKLPQQDTVSSIYSFLPLTPELSPQVASVNQPTFSFDPAPNAAELLIKTEGLFSGLLTVVSTRETKPSLAVVTTASLPTITSFGRLYPTTSQSTVTVAREHSKVELFNDVDRDEFDQYLGAPLEKTQLSNSLRNIIAELEDNYKYTST